jgi:hypothetical protein
MRSIGRAVRSVPLHPFLVAATPVLSGFASYHLAPAVVPRPLLAAWLMTSVALLIFSVLLRSVLRGGVATTLLAITVILRAPVLLGVALALVAGTLLWRFERIGLGDLAARATRAANIFALILLLIASVTWSAGGGIGLATRDLAAARSHGPAAPNDPDIVVVLLDGYPRADSLAQWFGFSNQPFLDELTHLGFEVSDDSRSNYDSTALTLASMLNMAYLGDQPALSGIGSGAVPVQPTLREVTNDNEAFRLLRSRGYEIVTVGSGWEEISLRRGDRYVDSGDVNEFETVLIETTSLAATIDALDPDFFGRQIRHRAEYNLHQLPELLDTSAERPRFIFVHVPLPHYPIVYAADGSPVAVSTRDLYRFAPPDASKDDLVAAYNGQIEHLNRLVLDVLRDLPVKADRERVILIMSDHGSLTDLGGDEERLNSFLAVRAPERPGLLGDRPSPVQYLPRIFNEYLGMSLPVPASQGFLTDDLATLQFRQAYGPGT